MVDTLTIKLVASQRIKLRSASSAYNPPQRFSEVSGQNATLLNATHMIEQLALLLVSESARRWDDASEASEVRPRRDRGSLIGGPIARMRNSQLCGEIIGRIEPNNAWHPALTSCDAMMVPGWWLAGG